MSSQRNLSDSERRERRQQRDLEVPPTEPHQPIRFSQVGWLLIAAGQWHLLLPTVSKLG